MRKAWKTAVLGTVMATALGSGTGCAADLADPAGAVKPHAKFIKYEFFQNNMNPAYPLAWDVMKPLYKGSQYDMTPNFSQANPLIGIGEFDLNGDRIPEVIAFPTEDEAEAGMYCTADSVCPHYVLDVSSGDKPQLLGKIAASSLDRGDKITNGYWELKAYTHDWTTPRTDQFDLYVYDKKTKTYLKEAPPAPGQ